MPKKRIAVISSGGDAPGMNAALRGVVRSAHHFDIEVMGAHHGYDGLIDQQLMLLEPGFVANCLQRGGTILRTARAKRFHESAAQTAVAAYLKEMSIDGLIVLGGNGSFAGANALHQHSHIPVVGIPCTIDNDIQGTEYCIGFDTACNTALEAIDRIRDTALSLNRHFIIEVMGRKSGFLATTVGLAGGAALILTPEHPMSCDDIIARLKSCPRKKLTSIIVAAEADQAGWTIKLAEEMNQRCEETYKVCILGHTQRGGTPTAYDRMTAGQMGYHAVHALLDNKKSCMAAVQQGSITTTALPNNSQTPREFTQTGSLSINQVLSLN